MSDLTVDILILVMFVYFALMSLVNRKPVSPRTAELYTKESNEKLSLVMGIIYAVGALLYAVVVLGNLGLISLPFSGWIPTAVIVVLLGVSYVVASRRILVPKEETPEDADH